ERLRNDNGVGDVSVFALHAVPLAFRTYVHVELPVSEPEPEPFDVSFHEPSIPPPPPTPVMVEVAEVKTAEVEVPEVEVAEVEFAEVEFAEVEFAEFGEQFEAEPAVDVETEPTALEPDDSADAADTVEPFDEVPPIGDAAPFETPELDLEDPAPVVESEPAAERLEVEYDVALVAELPAPPPPPSDFFELFADYEAPEAPAADVDPDPPTEAEGFAAELVAVFDLETDQTEAVAETAAASEPFEIEPFDADAAQVEIEGIEPFAEDGIPVPQYESSASELPPLTLAPGPLLFDGDDAPASDTGAYDAVEEAPAALTDLIPADFTDLIPKDIAHGDLVKHPEAEAPAPLVERAEPSPEVPEVPVAEQAPSTDELPPIDVAEIPSDVSSIEVLAAAAIPVARETDDEPVATSHREGPRGLGYFGG
ncbi:MAG: hypothetical protein QOI76_3532, partial [Frankiales bacterium]|nr:hypothetical protein [Frankiales bacterium]